MLDCNYLQAENDMESKYWEVFYERRVMNDVLTVLAILFYQSKLYQY